MNIAQGVFGAKEICKQMTAKYRKGRHYLEVRPNIPEAREIDGVFCCVFSLNVAIYSEPSFLMKIIGLNDRFYKSHDDFTEWTVPNADRDLIVNKVIPSVKMRISEISGAFGFSEDDFIEDVAG